MEDCHLNAIHTLKGALFILIDPEGSLNITHTHLQSSSAPPQSCKGRLVHNDCWSRNMSQKEGMNAIQTKLRSHTVEITSS